jgi:hypothetical protein
MRIQRIGAEGQRFRVSRSTALFALSILFFL